MSFQYFVRSMRGGLSRDIEPNLCKNQKTKGLVEKAVATILQDELKNEIEAILLFGSHVDGAVTPLSDIDICVVFKRHCSLKEVTAFRIRVSGNLPDVVDVQVFHVLPQKIKRAIALHHRVLYAGARI